jgi:sulfate transport system ATP-binding protein
MNGGRVEQAAPPRVLYDAPANEFVMSFVGQANRFGAGWVRPHDLQVTLEPNATTREVLINRLVHVGHEVRAELVRDDGELLNLLLARDEADRLELAAGQIVFVQPVRETVFSSDV